MKVVFATHRTNQWLGVNKYFYLLGKHLKKLGVEAHFIVDSNEGVKMLESCDITTFTVLYPLASNPLSTMQYCHNLAKTLNEVDFDILHCGHVLPYFYLKREDRKPVVFQPFGNELFTLAGKGLNKWYCKLVQPILRFCGENCDVLLSEGEFQHKEMERYYPLMKRLEVLPVGVDGMTPKTNYATGKYFQFLAVNSLLPYEGMDELISAFRSMNHGCIGLVIVGAGREEGRLKRMAEGLPVFFKKNIPESELKELYRSSDAFVCTSHETDFQMGVLEAMASGLPVISREADWLPNSVLPFKDKSELVSVMSIISSASAITRTERAQKGLKEVEQYNYTKIAEKALKIYGSLLVA